MRALGNNPSGKPESRVHCYCVAIRIRFARLNCLQSGKQNLGNIAFDKLIKAFTDSFKDEHGACMTLRIVAD